MKKYAINLDKVEKFIFDEPFVTTEIVETYELDDMDSSNDEIKLVSKQSHEIKNNTCDLVQLRMGFINQFLTPFINDDEEASDVLKETMLKYGYLTEID